MLSLETMTERSPTAVRAVRTSSSCLRVWARTATSPARSGRPSKVVRPASSRVISAAQSRATSGRTDPIEMVWPGCSTRAFGTARSRTGASIPSGAMPSPTPRREPSRAARTGWTTICSSPSCAPPRSAPRLRTSGPSERWLTPRVCRVVADSAAVR